LLNKWLPLIYVLAFMLVIWTGIFLFFFGIRRPRSPFDVSMSRRFDLQSYNCPRSTSRVSSYEADSRPSNQSSSQNTPRRSPFRIFQSSQIERLSADDPTSSDSPSNETSSTNSAERSSLKLVAKMKSCCQRIFLRKKKSKAKQNFLSSHAKPAFCFDDKIESEECPICMDNAKDMAFGCGHRACSSCARQIHECHVCRRRITFRLKLYS